MTVLHPGVLWLLVLPLLVGVYQMRNTPNASPGRKLRSVCLRVLVLSALVLALARPLIVRTETARQVVAVVDCSPSMKNARGWITARLQELTDRFGRDNLHVVVFGSRARELSNGDAALEPEAVVEAYNGAPGSDAAKALALAAVLCPDDGNGEIKLLSDGRETSGDTVAAAADLGSRALRIEYEPAATRPSEPVLLSPLRLPAAARVGEAVAVVATLESPVRGEVTVTLRDEVGKPVASRTVLAEVGIQHISFLARPEHAGFQRYSVAVDGSRRTLSGGLLVEETVVGVFESAPERPAGGVFREILGRSAEIRPLSLADFAGAGLKEIDVIVLADTPAAELPEEVQGGLRSWIEGGGGLLVTGGRNAFGPGGYAHSQLADILPLRFPQKKEVRDPSVALAVIIDTSGSMGRSGVDLAKEVARLALKRLKPHDKAGIVEFHGAKRWAAPMQPASNAIAIQRALNRLSAGGGTVMLPAIEEAFYGLMNVRARSKHVLVLTDGGVETGAFQGLVRSMADNNIHVSTVLVGPRAGSGFLASLANWGQGQFFAAPSRFKIPEIIFKQPSSSLLNPFVEEDMGLEAGLSSELTRALAFEEAPAVQGYVQTEAKDTAEVLLRSEIGDPVLARWHYGLGRTAILTTRLGGGWSDEFLNWSGTRDMLANLVRQLCGVSPRRLLALDMEWSPGGLDIEVGSLQADSVLAAVPLHIELKKAGGAPVVEQVIAPIEANRWRTRIEGVEPGDYLVEVSAARGGETLAGGGVTVPAPAEFSRIGIGREELAAAWSAGGAARLAEPASPVRVVELWPVCAGFGLAVFLLMVLLRRLPGASDAQRAPGRAGGAAMVLLAAVLLAPTSASALNLFVKMRVNDILGLPSAKAREEFKKYLPKVKFRDGDLTPICDYLRSQGDTRRAEPLLAMALAANNDFDGAETLLAKLVAQPGADPWFARELTRVRTMRAAHVDRSSSIGAFPTSLSAEERERVSDIADMDPADAVEAMDVECQRLFRKYGDLTLLCDYLRAMPSSSAVKRLLAIAASANGDVAAADEALAALAEEPQADVWVLSQQARIKELQGEDEEAAALFEGALEKTSDPRVRFALRIRTAQLFYETDREDDARAILRAVAVDPDCKAPDSGNYSARIASLHGDYELAVELFQPTGEGKVRRRNLLYMGECMMQLEKPGEAREYFEAALELSELERDRRYVLDRLVTAARTVNALPELMDEWVKSDSIVPEQLEILVTILGGELDRVDDVFALLDREDLAPRTSKLIESAKFQEELALLASETGRSKLAGRTYRELIAQHPDRSYYREGYARLLLLEGDRAAAESVFREAMARSATSGELMVVAAGARGMGLKDVAAEAAAKAGEMRGPGSVQAALFMADLHREQGETDKALAILKEQEARAGDDVDTIMLLAHAYERHDYAREAIRLCQKASELSESERVLRKLIALLEEHNRHDEVFELWRKLWETATEPMMIVQANDRLLDIGAKTGRLADLAVELEERLDGGSLRDRELALLLDVYTSVNDPVSAADILMELSKTEGGKRVLTYKRLLKVYMECELFGKCNAILKKLIELDPDNRDEHLQTLALIALERQNKGDAMVVLEQLADRSEDGILRDSFSASVLTMIGQPIEAARTYRRGLADNSDEVEAWLLWANALAARDAEERAAFSKQRKRPPNPQSQAGHKQATHTFAAMLEESEADDLFTICVDGLLNLRARPHLMSFARRRLYERIAADPHNLLLYRLAADVNEELKRRDDAARMLENALVVADDGRSIIIRELIAMAQAGRRQDDVIAYSRTLLNTTMHLPPGECLQLGTILLERGHVSEADAAFQRILSDGTAFGAARDVIQRYENFGLFAKAGKVVRSLLIGTPFDVDLILRLGLIEEKNGDFAAAGRAYERALDLMLGRIPRRTMQGSRSQTGSRYNVSELQQFRELALRGLIASARTPERCRELLDSAMQRVRTELQNLERDSAFADNFEGNPRLRNVAGIVRRLSFVFNHFEYADSLDAELFERYPHDQELRSVIAGVRRRWQAPSVAGEFLIAHGIEDDVGRAVAPFLRGKDAVAEMLKKGDISPAGQAAAITFLGMSGYDDLIDMALADCDLTRTPEQDSWMLLVAGTATDRPGLTREALFTKVSRLRRTLEGLHGKALSKAYFRPTEAFKHIVAAWPHLSEQDRSSAVSLYGMMPGVGDSTSVLGASYDYLRCRAGRSDEIKVERIDHYLSRFGFMWKAHLMVIFDSWLGDRPPAERPAAVRRLLGEKDEKGRTKILRRLAGYLSEDTLTDELRQEFPDLVIERKSEDGDPLAAPPVDMAAKRAEFQGRIRATRLQMGQDIRKVMALRNETLRTAAGMLPAAELDVLLKGVRDSRDPFDMLIAFLLLRDAGRDREALVLLNRFDGLGTDDPKSEAVLAALPGILKASGWFVQALRLLPEGASRSGGHMSMFFNLHDPLAVLGGGVKNALAVSERRVHAARLLKAPEQLLQAARIYHADRRHPGVLVDHRSRFRATQWPARMVEAQGGLMGMRRDADGIILMDLARLPGGQDELIWWLRSVPSQRLREAGVTAAIAKSVREYGLSDDLREMLKAAAGRSSLNRFDVDLIDAIASQAPQELPPELADQIPTIVFHDWRGDTGLSARTLKIRKSYGIYRSASERVANLSAACRALGRNELARSLGRWSVMLDLLDMGSSPNLSVYLEAVPEEEREATLRELLPYMGLSDVRVIVGDGLEQMLTALLDEGMAIEAGKMVDRFLRARPCRPLISSYILLSSPYASMMGGLESDKGAKDAALLVALARLGRSEDYKRLLWQVGREDSRRESGPGGGFDFTAAMPDPSQVDDIAYYIDLQTELLARLRMEGMLSPEKHVAQVCRLGEWCVTRGLQDPSTRLLTQAEELSAEMLLGRLWVADLHRLLGNEHAAVDIELMLLDLDLLPLPRVPSALESLAAREGQARADKAAFQVARYSNHADVLPGALHYARDQEMKQEYLELAERLRKVSTLFLPRGIEPSLDGYASLPEWSASVAATAARLPATPKPRPLTELAYDRHPAIAQVMVKGTDPEMIYVPILHDGPFSHISSVSMDGVHGVLGRCNEIADHLYHRYNVRHVLLEGLGPEFVAAYNRIPPERRVRKAGAKSATITHEAWAEMLDGKAWVLVPAHTNDTAMVGPLTALGYKYDGLIADAMKQAKTDGWLRNRETFEKNRAALESKLNNIAEEYNGHLADVLEKDPGLKGEFAITVTERNKALLDNILAADGPGVVFFGAAHWYDLERQLADRGTSYALIVPKGVDWPRKKKDDAAIYADMMRLGCKLKECAVELGDGGSDRIVVPIN